MYYEVHIGKDGRILTPAGDYLRRHDIVYHAPAYEPYDGMPVGEGDIAGLFCVRRDSLCFHANKSDLFDDRTPGDFGAWGSEWEEKAPAQVAAGDLIVSDGLPSWDDLYLKAFEKRLNLGAGRLELSSETPFSAWTGRVFGSHPDGVMVFRYHAHAAYPVERTVSLQKWGSRTFTHYYEVQLADPSVRAEGTKASAADGCGLIEVGLATMRYVIAARVLCDGAEWRVRSPHEALCTLPAAQDCDFTVLLTAVTSEEADDPEAAARERLERAAADPVGVKTRAAADWKAFAEKSFVHLPEDYLENLWYMTLWQMFVSFRGSFPAAFNGGSFLWNRDVRNWGHIYHWNGQIPYWGVQSGGHPELFGPYARFRRRMLPAAQDEARKMAYEGAFYSDIAGHTGGQAMEPDTASNLTCGPQIAMHLYRQWEYTRDDAYLRDTALPVMRECARFYLSRLKKDARDGLWHLESSTVFEGYLALRDAVTDRVLIESLFRATLAAEEHLGEPSDLTERMREVLARLYPFRLTGWEGRQVLSCGCRGDGQPLGFRDTVYPEATGMLGELSALYPGSEHCMARDTLREPLRSTLEAHLALRLFDCGHTPLAMCAAALGLPVQKMLLELAEHSQVFPSGLSHFKDAWAEAGSGSEYRVRLLDGSEDHTPWSKMHEKAEFDRVTVPQSPYLHCYLETMGQLFAAVNESLLDSRDGVIRVFPCPTGKGLAMFRLLARGGCFVTAEKDGDVRYIALDALREDDFTVAIPWKGETCLYRGGAVDYAPEAERLTLHLQPGHPLVLCPRARQLEVMYQTVFDTVVNNGVKRNGKSRLGT